MQEKGMHFGIAQDIYGMGCLGEEEKVWKGKDLGELRRSIFQCTKHWKIEG